MLCKDFDFHLPEELIATEPAATRVASRLLTLDPRTGQLHDRQFVDVLRVLQPGDLLVLNDTRVLAARLYGHKCSGGKVEILVERVLTEHTALAHVRASKAPRVGSRLQLDCGVMIEVVQRVDDLFTLSFLTQESLSVLLMREGQVPLPPYMKRAPVLSDSERYQTVYAREQGSVAAPTAGLHFDENLLAQLQQRGVELGFLTLHIGAGTFQPVRVADVTEHVMHSEWFSVSAELCEQVQRTRARQGRVVAVGTTCTRALESAASSGQLQPLTGETSIFIYPGYTFRCVDALITNFHLPASTLLMLVAAFAGLDAIQRAYQHAIAQKYRFYSYGDAMFIACSTQSTV